MKTTFTLAGFILGLLVFCLYFNPATLNAQESYFECEESCADDFNATYDEIFHTCYAIEADCKWEIINRDTADGTVYCKGYFAESCWDELREQCEIPYEECLGVADREYEACIEECPAEHHFSDGFGDFDFSDDSDFVSSESDVIDFESTESVISDGYIGDCLNVCFLSEQNGSHAEAYNACIDSCYKEQVFCDKDCNDLLIIQEPVYTDDYDDYDYDYDDYDYGEYDYGYDDYESLVPAQEQFDDYKHYFEEKADEAYEKQLKEKEEFVEQHDLQMEEIVKDLSPEQAEEIRDTSAIVRAGLEQVKDAATAVGNIKDYKTYLDTGEFSNYGGVSLFVDAASSLVDYADQRAKGVSEADAATKATLDNFGVSAINTIPVFKVIDLVATTPDKILSGLGFDKKGVLRQVTGFIAKVSPSGVIKETTELMVHDDWEDIGNALAHGWNKVVEAEGVVNTTFESAKLVAGTIGAGAVSVARLTSDTLSGVMALGEAGADFFSGLFRTAPANPYSN